MERVVRFRLRHDPRASVTFEVYGDVKEMGEQPELLAKTPILSGKPFRSRNDE